MTNYCNQINTFYDTDCNLIINASSKCTHSIYLLNY